MIQATDDVCAFSDRFLVHPTPVSSWRKTLWCAVEAVTNNNTNLSGSGKKSTRISKELNISICLSK